MCGIVGKYYFDMNMFQSDDLPVMMNSIRHRGPDESGCFEDTRVALGFQRLSIIDTVSGNQPLYNESKSVVAIANGEIYNYQELRSVLLSKGHVFRTNSDCEVLPHMYEEFGKDFVGQLNGMFAFCVYDSAKGILIIARDRMGKKPFYIFRNSKILLFASEVKGILASREAHLEEQKDALMEYLSFRCLSANKTFFAGIEALEPGTAMEITPAGCKSWGYWKLEIESGKHFIHDASERISSTLHEAVKRQMMSDVPLGTLLSGGVDSSWVSAIAGGISPGLKTFTVGFHEKGYDETRYAKQLAQANKLDYHEIRVGSQEFCDVLPKAIWYNDEPLSHANSVQIYLVCKYAKQYVKVLLTGEGADELFGGYPRYYLCKLGEHFLRLDSFSKQVIRFTLRHLHMRKIEKLYNVLGLSGYELIFWNAEFEKHQKVAWLFDKEKAEFPDRMEVLFKTWRPELDLMSNLLLFELKTYLPAILMRQDKMSMAASIEARIPILDNEMIALASSIPASQKIQRFQPKYLFKHAAAKEIPSNIVYKRKVGFAVPVGSWLRDKNGLGKILDMLLDVRNKINELNRTKVEVLVNEHISGKRNHEDILWPLVNYVLWREIFFTK